MLWLSGPLAAQFVATLALPVISNISVGHLNDPIELSASVLGNSFFMVRVVDRAGRAGRRDA